MRVGKYLSHLHAMAKPALSLAPFGRWTRRDETAQRRSPMLAMKLDRTRELIHRGVDTQQPLNGLIHVLESALELVVLPDNDFCWSSWKDAEEAKTEIESILQLLQSGGIPDRLAVSVLFAPTGPLQEVSLSSGWADPFLKVAEKFDDLEKLIW